MEMMARKEIWQDILYVLDNNIFRGVTTMYNILQLDMSSTIEDDVIETIIMDQLEDEYK